MIRLSRKHPCHPHHDAAHNGGPVRLEGANKEILEVGRNRLALCAGLFAVAFAVLSLRLVDLTLISQAREPQLDRGEKAAGLPLARADIVDRNGALLATSLATASLYADPTEVQDPAAAARRLAAVLPDLKAPELVDKLAGDRRFVWIRRNLTPRQAYEINRLGIPGLYFQREDRRVYPHGVLTGHVVGFTNVDNHGMAGIERYFDETLSRSGARSARPAHPSRGAVGGHAGVPSDRCRRRGARCAHRRGPGARLAARLRRQPGGRGER
jgi:cell division protein FtsI (penicillin-binding protein 3)